MADVTITAANVIAPNPVQLRRKWAAEDITAGQPVRDDPSDSTSLLLSQATTVAAAKCVGIAANSAKKYQPCIYFRDQDIDFGSGVFVQGETYVVSATKGALAPESDLGSGESSTKVGMATSTSNLSCRIHESGVLIP